MDVFFLLFFLCLVMFLNSEELNQPACALQNLNTEKCILLQSSHLCPHFYRRNQDIIRHALNRTVMESFTFFHSRCPSLPFSPSDFLFQSILFLFLTFLFSIPLPPILSLFLSMSFSPSYFSLLS